MKKITNKQTLQKRTLALGRETIRHLSGARLDGVVGGILTATSACTFNCTVTCHTHCGDCGITRTIQCDSNGIACTSNCTIGNA